MDFSSNNNNLFSKKNLISYLMLAILILAIPLAVRLVQQQQILKSKAAEERIKFSGSGVDCSKIECTSVSPKVDIEVLSPLGPPKP